MTIGFWRGKLEGKRAPQVYQLVCHIVWRLTEFRPTAVEARFNPSSPASVHCAACNSTRAAGIGAPRGQGCF